MHWLLAGSPTPAGGVHCRTEVVGCRWGFYDQGAEREKRDDLSRAKRLTGTVGGGREAEGGGRGRLRTDALDSGMGGMKAGKR